MSLASQVEGLRFNGTTWPDLKLAAFFRSGPRWQVLLEHHANYNMPPTSAYMYACLHVGKYVSYLPHVLTSESWHRTSKNVPNCLLAQQNFIATCAAGRVDI